MSGRDLTRLFEGHDPSLPLATAAIMRHGAPGEHVPFGKLAVEYRQEHIELTLRDRGDAVEERGTLSVDEARRHLEKSVLPRLVSLEVIEPIPEQVDDQTPIIPAESLREIADATAMVRQLRSLALETVRAAEATGEEQPRLDGASVLRAEGLTKIYRKRKVVDDVDLYLRQGEIVGLLGPNGAGKTTTFYMIVGLIRPDDGSIFISERDISSEPMYVRARHGIGYLAQEPSVFRKLTVEQNIMAILETLGLTEAERSERLETLLDELSIKHLRKTKAYSLSGGERRRLEITRALVTDPKFMLLDEPFAGVDPIAVNDIQTIVAGLRRKGIGVLITDHNVEQTLDIVDRAYIMFEGKVKVSGTVRELVFDDHVSDVYFGPTLTARLRSRLGEAA